MGLVFDVVFEEEVVLLGAMLGHGAAPRGGGGEDSDNRIFSVQRKADFVAAAGAGRAELVVEELINEVSV